MNISNRKWKKVINELTKEETDFEVLIDREVFQEKYKDFLQRVFTIAQERVKKREEFLSFCHKEGHAAVCADCVVDWCNIEVEGEKLECTFENKLYLFTENYEITEQILNYAYNPCNFYS